MTEPTAALDLFRDQLHDAVARDLSRRPRRRATGGVIGVAGVGAAAALALTIVGGAGPPVVEGAIARHVIGALTAPPATILHERALVTLGSTTQPYEVWAETSPPFAYRVIKWGHEGTGRGGAPDDPAAQIRSMVQSGQAHIDAATTIDGVPAYKLTVSGSSTRFLNGTAYVSRANYRPLEIDTTDGGGERIVFQSYEYLPTTPASQALLH
jgi:hypothetical protein